MVLTKSFSQNLSDFDAEGITTSGDWKALQNCDPVVW